MPRLVHLPHRTAAVYLAAFAAALLGACSHTTPTARPAQTQATVQSIEGVALPPAVLAHMQSSASHQVTMLLRTCGFDSQPSFKVEHYQGRPGQDRQAIWSSVDQLAEQRGAADSPAAIEASKVLDYAFVIGPAGIYGKTHTSLWRFQPTVTESLQLTNDAGEEALFEAFPLLKTACPSTMAATATQAVQLEGLIELRFIEVDDYRLSFGSDRAAATAAYNRLVSAMSEVRLPDHLLGFRDFTEGSEHLGQMSKWTLPSGASWSVVLELKAGQWTMSATKRSG